jgi:hypothetical protein
LRVRLFFREARYGKRFRTAFSGHGQIASVGYWPLDDIRQPEKSLSPYRSFRFLNFQRCHRQQPTHHCRSAVILRFPKPDSHDLLQTIPCGQSELKIVNPRKGKSRATFCKFRLTLTTIKSYSLSLLQYYSELYFLFFIGHSHLGKHLVSP